MTKQRLWQLDALRGLALLNMLAYHAMYDWVYVFGHAGSWYNIGAPGCHVWQQYICWSFILLSDGMNPTVTTVSTAAHPAAISPFFSGRRASVKL